MPKTEIKSCDILKSIEEFSENVRSKTPEGVLVWFRILNGPNNWMQSTMYRYVGQVMTGVKDSQGTIRFDWLNQDTCLKSFTQLFLRAALHRFQIRIVQRVASFRQLNRTLKKWSIFRICRTPPYTTELVFFEGGRVVVAPHHSLTYHILATLYSRRMFFCSLLFL